MAVVFFVNWCAFGFVLSVGLLVALSLSMPNALDFHALTGVGPGRAALWAAAVLIWTGPLAAVSMLVGDDSAKSGAAEEAGDDASSERRGVTECDARDAAAAALVGLLASAGALGGTLWLAVAAMMAAMMAAITMRMVVYLPGFAIGVDS